jgi:phage tail tape-measure protein
MTHAGEAMLKDTPKVTRYVLTRIPKAPGFLADVASFATAKDKVRAGLGIAGGFAGGAIGEAGGPVGAAIGSAAGEAGAEWLYDHRAQLTAKAADTAQWMKDRTAQAASPFAHAFDQGMPPYATPMY